MMGWKSAFGVLQHGHRHLCFVQPPSGAGLPTESEIRPDRALPQTASGQLGPLVTIRLGGMSLAELSAIHQQVVEETRSPEVAALQEIWSQWSKKKAVHRTGEWETLGCRVARTLGVMASPPWRHQRPPGAHWVVLRCNSTQPQRVPDPGWQMVAVLSVPTRSFLRVLTFVVRHLPQCTPTKTDSGNCYGPVGGHLSPAALALQHALWSSPPTHLKEALASSSPPRSRLPALTNYRCGRYQQPLPVTSWFITELNAGIGGLRRPAELLDRVPGVYAASDGDPSCFQVLDTVWPTTVWLMQVAAVRSSHIAQLVQSAPHVTKRLIGGTIPARGRFDQRSFGHPQAKKAISFIMWDGS